MNRTNGKNLLAEGKSSHLPQETVREPRPTQSGFNSFLRWFKKNEKHCQIGQTNNNSIIQDTKTRLNNELIKTDYYNSNDTLSPSSSPILEKKYLIGSSSDSVFSTATNGFAFISPNNYRPTAYQHEKSIVPGPVTESYRRRVKQQESAREFDERLELTLRRKYQIFDETEGTINPIYLHPTTPSNYDNLRIYSDCSLPNVKTYYDHNETYLWGSENSIPKSHRRTTSDRSKDKQPYLYVHVKGKRKAPAPPPIFKPTVSAELGSSFLITESSTLNRKKRKAPQPPNNCMCEIIFKESLLEDKGIKAILESPPNKNFHIMSEETPSKNLTENQKHIVLENIINLKKKSSDNIKSEIGVSNTVLSKDTLKMEKQFELQMPESLKNEEYISLKPWYKRPLSGNCDINVPFKTEVLLKTVDKRKTKQKKKDKNQNEQIPDVRISRNSIFESASKLVFFSRNDKEEKRKSGINIPNISSLDREAVEIINKENAVQHAKFLKLENEKYYQPPKILFLRSKFTNCNSKINHSDEDTDQHKSTKELITKFEESFNTHRVAVNMTYIGRTDLFENVKNNFKEIKTSSPVTVPKELSIIEKPVVPFFSTSKITTQNLNEIQNENLSIELQANQNIEMLNLNSKNNISGKWSCPYCTLENPNWRIICEVCEKIKPYGLESTTKLSKENYTKNLINNNEQVEEKQEQNNTIDWDKKAEKIKKYFGTREAEVVAKINNSGVNILTKSTSETSIRNENIYARKKIQSSPKFNKKDYFGSDPIHPIKTQRSSDKTIVKRNYDNSFKLNNNDNNFQLNNNDNNINNSSGLFLSSVIGTTDISEPIEHTNNEKLKSDLINENLKLPIMDQMRTARLARFNSPNTKMFGVGNLTSNASQETELEIVNTVIHQEALEKEKERLREMIRQMNSRALAEKYPIVIKQNPNEKIDVEVDPQSTIQASTEAPKLGAIKKLFHHKNIKKCDANKTLTPTEIFKKMEIKNKNKELEGLNDIQQLQNDEKNTNSTIQENFILTDTTFSPNNNEQVEEITKILKSRKGLEHFRTALKSSSKQLSDTNTLAINKILKNLEKAIASGQYETASTLAKTLARMKVSLCVTRQRDHTLSTITNHDESFIVDMFVEDKISSKGPIQLTISKLLTVTDLKKKISKDFNIPVNIQKWILNKQEVTNEKLTLEEFGIKDHNSVLYLYLNDLVKYEKQLKQDEELRKVEEKITLQDYYDSEDGDMSNCQNETIARALPQNRTDNTLGTMKIGWACPLCTLINSPVRPGCLACSESRPINYSVPKQFQEMENDFIIIKDELKSILKCGKDKTAKTPVLIRRQTEKKNDLNKLNLHRKSSELLNITVEENKTQHSLNINKNNMLTTLTEPENMNLPNQNNANIVLTAAITPLLASPSPSPNITRNKYRGVDNFNPKTNQIVYQKINQHKIISPNIITPKVFKPKLKQPTPIRLVQNDKTLEDILKPSKLDITKNRELQPSHYMEILNLDYADVVPNIDEFECPICFIKYGNSKGVILRDCLHTFCRDCLAHTVKYSNDAEIKCPYMDSEYSCESLMQDREIKALVTREIYEQHLSKSVNQAEHGIENTFHCKTPNCHGWCIYEDNVNQFKCPVCMITNCLTCQSIHDGLNCKQYQDRIISGCDTNLASRRTKEMLQDMVDKGEAMNCPTCQVVLMKKWGCDWLRCSMCKTEICWITRGKRWGPNGKGDTTGGCKCGLDGKKCHPKCSYCH